VVSVAEAHTVDTASGKVRYRVTLFQLSLFPWPDQPGLDCEVRIGNR